jgi:hypothetical protein
VDVEACGDLTRGMSEVDQRVNTAAKQNVDLGVGVDGEAGRGYIDRVMRLAE